MTCAAFNSNASPRLSGCLIPAFNSFITLVGEVLLAPRNISSMNWKLKRASETSGNRLLHGYRPNLKTLRGNFPPLVASPAALRRGPLTLPNGRQVYEIDAPQPTSGELAKARRFTAPQPVFLKNGIPSVPR